MKQISVFVGLAALALLAFLARGTLHAQGSTTVFINEIHYDNASTDTGEAIEIVGPAGTDLTGWTVVLYNGSNGALYDSIVLTGVIPDQDNGFGALSFAAVGLQNGSPDGIALVHGSDVIQFLSYEGSFVAVGGAADGLLSTNIGVIESGSDPAGWSLQLTGVGTVYEDFSWAAPAASTFGAVNTGQTFGDGGGDPTPTPTEPAPTAALVINEVDYDQASTDTAEFVEIKNNDTVAVKLDGYSVIFINGSGGAIYQTFALPDLDLAAGGYFVICANADNTPNCDLDVSTDTNLIQNGAPDAIAIVQGGTVIDALSYEGVIPGYAEGNGYVEDSTDDNAGLSRFPDGADTNDNVVDFSVRCITPGAANTTDNTQCPTPGTGGGPQIGLCGGDATLISTIQGDGALSPFDGQAVVIEGVVVGDFQDLVGSNGDLNGFYVQEEDVDSDGNGQTSEGIFVFQGSNPSIDVNIGDLVRVLGTIDEFGDPGTELTEIKNITLLQCGTASLPAVTPLSLPFATVSEPEQYEGMYVTLPQPLVISEYFNFDRFNEMVLAKPMTGEDRLYQPTAVNEPGSPEAAARADYNARSQITLDDGRSASNPDLLLHPNGNSFDINNRFRGGDIVQNATGVLDHSFGLYRIHPTQAANYTAVNLRPTMPDAIGGNLRVASFNVLNYFTTLDYPSGDPLDNACGPLATLECRGADSDQSDELTRQRTKIIAALKAIDADIVGLLEIENHPADAAIIDLVAGLNDAMGAGTYDYLATGAIGSDAIRVALIYKPATVSLIGAYAILDSSVDPRFIDTSNRPALAQTFQDKTTGGIFTVAVNHLKSKGSGCGTGDDDPEQGNCNGTRTLAAQALVDWLALDPTGSGDADYLIIGDLNAYDKEDPIAAIRAGTDDALGNADDYIDLIAHLVGEFAYSYLFSGQLGYLDHALANQPLLDEVSGVTDWHINADEPDIFDYDTSFKPPAQDALYESNAYRASDHDPVIVGLNVCDEIAPTLSVTLSTDKLWPPNHQYVKVEATVAGSDNFDTDPIITLHSATSNEPDNGIGDGDQENDIVQVNDTTFNLRAERAGNGTGRVYTITYEVTDACGNSTTAFAEVVVPLNQKGGKNSQVDGSIEGSATDVEEAVNEIFLPLIQNW